jgi:hypothetical protein
MNVRNPYKILIDFYDLTISVQHNLALFWLAICPMDQKELEVQRK